jgi:hypothetical protein
MAGQYRFKDINGNVVAQISSSADGTISFSGSAVDFSNASTITLGEVQMAGTASNALLLDGFDSTAFVFTSSFNTISQSISSQLNTLQTTSDSNVGRLDNLESKSSSVDISISNINSFTASNNITSLNSKTGSYATTGSNTFFGTQTYSGSVYIANDLIVQGSSSIQYISASSVSIGTNIVQLNTATPSVRFAGISVQDSGSSAGITGSMLWDSLCNRWIYSNPSTIGYSGGMLLSGPRTQTLGTEPTLTCNYIAKSGGGDHLYDSCIIDDGTTTCIKNNLISTGTISGTDIYASTVSCSPVGCFTTLCTEYLYPYNISMGNTFIRANGNKLGIGTGNPLGVLSITGGQNSLSSLATYSSIEPLGIFNMFYINSGTYPFYLDIAAIGDTMSANGGSNIRFLTHCGTANATPVERMRIDNCGNIGIGTMCPTGTYGKLSVAGGISILNDNTAKLEIGRYSNSICNSYIKIGTNSNSLRITNAADSIDLVTFANCGFVGIGTTCPTEMLHLNNTNTNGSFIRFQNTGGSGVYLGGRSENMELYAGGAERMRITNCGYVVIGNTTAYGGLTVSDFTANDGNDSISLFYRGTSGAHQSLMKFYDFRGQLNASMGNELHDDTPGTPKARIVFKTSNGSSPVERMRISSEGIVTKPFNPAFRAYYSVNGSWVLAEGATFAFDVTEYNIGSAYNTSNGTFTAPVAGVYQFNFYTIVLGNYGNAAISFRKNGGVLTSGFNMHFSPYYTSTVWTNVVYTTSLYLNAGDYVYMINASGQVNYHGDDWSSFSGYLVG